MKPQPQPDDTSTTEQISTDQAMAEFLLRGGVVQQLHYCQSGRTPGDGYNPWGAGRKKKTTAVPVNSTDQDPGT